MDGWTVLVLHRQLVRKAPVGHLVFMCLSMIARPNGLAQQCICNSPTQSICLTVLFSSSSITTCQSLSVLSSADHGLVFISSRFGHGLVLDQFWIGIGLVSDWSQLALACFAQLSPYLAQTQPEHSRPDIALLSDLITVSVTPTFKNQNCSILLQQQLQ